MPKTPKYPVLFHTRVDAFTWTQFVKSLNGRVPSDAVRECVNAHLPHVVAADTPPWQPARVGASKSLMLRITHESAESINRAVDYLTQKWDGEPQLRHRANGDYRRGRLITSGMVVAMCLERAVKVGVAEGQHVPNAKHPTSRVVTTRVSPTAWAFAQMLTTHQRPNGTRPTMAAVAAAAVARATTHPHAVHHAPDSVLATVPSRSVRIGPQTHERLLALAKQLNVAPSRALGAALETFARDFAPAAEAAQPATATT